MSDGTCPVDDPEGHSRGSLVKGLCDKHYKRQWRNGTTDKLKVGRAAGFAGTLQERFDAKVIKDYNQWGCWYWNAATHDWGYGRINDRVDGELHQYRAHVLAWEWLAGQSVPKGLHLDHFLFPDGCIGPRCCNPWHVRPTSPRINALRSLTAGPARNARKTHCPKGHPYDIIRWSRVKGGGKRRRRECSICVAESRARRAENARARRKEQRCDA